MHFCIATLVTTVSVFVYVSIALPPRAMITAQSVLTFFCFFACLLAVVFASTLLENEITLPKETARLIPLLRIFFAFFILFSFNLSIFMHSPLLREYVNPCPIIPLQALIIRSIMESYGL